MAGRGRVDRGDSRWAAGGAIASAACADAACTPVTSHTRWTSRPRSPVSSTTRVWERALRSSRTGPRARHTARICSTWTPGVDPRHPDDPGDLVPRDQHARQRARAWRSRRAPSRSGYGRRSSHSPRHKRVGAGRPLAGNIAGRVRQARRYRSEGRTRVHFLREVRGVTKGFYDPVAFSTTDAVVLLRLPCGSRGVAVTGAYTVDGGPARTLATMRGHAGLLRALAGGRRGVATGGVFATTAGARLRCGTRSRTSRWRASLHARPDGPPRPIRTTATATRRWESHPRVRASWAGAVGAPAPPTAGEPRGTDAVATLKVRRRASVSRLLRRGLRGRLACSESCSASLSLRLRRGEKRRLPDPAENGGSLRSRSRHRPTCRRGSACGCPSGACAG